VDENLFLTTALNLARKGISVFPCWPGNKKPITKHGFKDATPDEKTIREWWGIYPDANVAVPMGERSGFFVLDVDMGEGKNGEAALAKLITLHGPLPATREARTPRGGRHLYFKYPGHRIPTRTNHPAPALDVRGDGGYVVIPPGRTDKGEYSWATKTAPAECPDWLLALLVSEVEQTEKPQSATPAPAMPHCKEKDEEEERVRSALECISASDYETWVKIGMALKSWDVERGLPIWDEWSRTCPEKYQKDEPPKKWASFKSNCPEGVTLGTLFDLAKRGGWSPSVSPSQWFAVKFPSLSEQYGPAVSEQTNNHGIVSVKDIGEDFLAATLGDKGSPDAPTIFLPTEEKFYTYTANDGIYIYQREPVLSARLSRMLLDCARACKNGCDTGTLQFRFRDSSNLNGVLRKARGLLDVPHDFFSTDLTEHIPCANGMLRLSDRALLPFSPSYRRRNKLAVPFGPAAKCPLFLDTLMRAALDDDALDLLQRWCGLALIGENLAQKILILTGTAGGGKGTFIRVLTGIIGQVNLASLRPQLLGERFELGRFLGKTLLYGADVPENFLNQRGASVLKSLTGYDPVTLEFKNSNESPSIICRFNVIVTCNSRLTVHLEGDTDAWRRRLAIIEYRKLKPAHVIADLDQQILRREASGVLNWMLAGLDKIRADEWLLRVTPQQQSAVDNLLLESDGHTLFVREELVKEQGSNLTLPDAFAAYVEYCNERGWAAMTRNKFSQEVGDVVARVLGITVRHDIPDAQRKDQRGWRGLRLRRKSSEPTEKTVSEVSERQPSDKSDTIPPVDSEKGIPETEPR
jgi:P4 family phage/plasmid primase-like protien